MATFAQIMTFIKMIAPVIIAECAVRGYKYPSAIIAQACIESAYGTSSLGYKYHNYFGMKCGSSWKGKSVNLATKEEYSVGTLTAIRDNFRVYDSVEEGVRGYFEFISTKRYENLKQAASPRHYVELLKQDGYATSSTYVTTVNSVIIKYNLNQYDEGQEVKIVDPEIVAKVLKGELGNGWVRQQNLSMLGYNVIEVQKKVNEVITAAAVVNPLKKQLGDYFSLIDLC